MKLCAATEAAILKAAAALRQGKLVVMPTETVYGLAADATNPDAIRKVFEAKGRPAENPLIVHVADLGQVMGVAAHVPEAAAKLIKRFWPGPLTLVLPKHPEIPAEVTAGLDTVGVRMPAHPVALDLIRAAGLPLAAPSANRFMRLSPTKAENIDPELAEKVAMILDGGPCYIGLESTVVDCTEDVPRILRPGGVTRADIQSALGYPLGELPLGGARKSPGMYRRHYAPRTPLSVVDALEEGQAGLVVGPARSEHQISMPNDARAYASSLYDMLHRLDGMGLDAIYVQRPPSGPEWEAVHDRLKKAGARD